MEKKKKSGFVDISNAREDEQKEVMEAIIDNDHCPFCRENLAKYHKKPILRTTKHWLVTENQWPYKKTKNHLLIILKEHAEKLADIPSEAGKELFILVKWIEKKYKIKGGAFALRFGDSKFSASTVNHLHVQFVEPDVYKLEPEESVVFYIGKPSKKESNGNN